MQSRPFRFGPAYLGSSAANILNPPTITGGVLNGSTFASGKYIKCGILLTHIHLLNKTATAATATLYIGQTAGIAGGTEFWVKLQSFGAYAFLDWYGEMPLYTVDFLSGLSDTASAIVIQGEGEIFVEGE